MGCIDTRKAEIFVGWRWSLACRKCQPSWKLEPSPKSNFISPHVELTMAPHAGFKTDEIKEKARKDLLYLLEGVSKDYRTALSCARLKLTFAACRFVGRRI